MSVRPRASARSHMLIHYRLAVALIFAVGCGRDPVPTEPIAPPAPPTPPAPSPPVGGLVEEHTPPLARVYEWVGVTWSGNGKELAYVLPDSTTAVALDLSTGVTRVLYAAAPQHVYQVVLSGNATVAFTVSGSASAEVRPGQEHVTIRRHAGGVTEVITDRHRMTSSPLHLKAIRVAANGALAYIVGSDSLFVTAGGGSSPKFVGTTCFSVVAVSPAGDGVVCYSSSFFRYALTGSTTSLEASNPGAAIRGSVWNQEGVFLVFDPQPPVCFLIVCTRGSERWAFEKYSDPASKFLTPAYPFPETTSLVSLSENGRSLVYANHYCANSSAIGCGRHQNTLYFADGISRTTRRIAVHSAVVSISISPDGTRVAYVAGDQLYILPTGQ